MQEPDQTPQGKKHFSLLAAAYGDALGWPFERGDVKTPPEKRTLALFDWEKKHRYNGLEKIRKGSYSDDTQLQLCVARARLRGKSWLEWFRKVELPFWIEYVRGGGRATKNSVRAWLNSTPPWRQKGKAQKGYFEAAGNGVAMRILPHILWAKSHGFEHFEELAKDILQDGISTHGHPLALIGALVYGYTLWSCWHVSESRHLLSTLATSLIKTTPDWLQWDFVKDLDREWSSSAEKAKVGLTWRESPEAYPTVWAKSLEQLKKELQTTEELLETKASSLPFPPKSSGLGTTATMFALYFFCRYSSPEEIFTATLRVRQLDTDTVASMAGGIIGHFYNWKTLKDIEFLEDKEYLENIAEQLATSPIVQPLPSIKPYRKAERQKFRREIDTLLSEKLDKPRSISLPDGRKGKPLKEHVQHLKNLTILPLRCDDGQTLHIHYFYRK